MKMSDVFELPIEVNRSGDMIFESLASQSFAAKAINNHDRLTQENAELREFALMVKNGVTSENDAAVVTLRIHGREAEKLLVKFEQKDESNT